MTNRSRPNQAGGDEGSILVLTLVLTVVLGAIVLALATYATTGLATSRVTDDRTAAMAAASAAVQWQIEEYTHKRATPCQSTTSLSPPTGIAASATTISMRCLATAPIDGHRAATLEARATVGGGTMTVTALVQVPRFQYVVNVIHWTAS